MYTRYPWHESIWQQVLARVAAGNLPHALLLTGGEGIGKQEFAMQLGQLLLCETFHANPTQTQLPCGHCQGCALNRAATHPDFKRVEPEAEGKVIAIDQIRQLGETLGLKSHYGLGKVAIIHPAHKMNTFAANSLLKTLEEPTADSLMILVTSRPSALLPTIRSRCQQIPFHQPQPEIAVTWLKEKIGSKDESQISAMLSLANGGPLEALKYLENNVPELAEELLKSFVNVTQGRVDPITVAKVWVDTDVASLVKWLILWTSYMIRLKYGQQQPDNYPMGQHTLKNLAASVDLLALFRFLDKLTETRRLLDTQANIQLLLEDLLISWYQFNSGNG